jgi:hypothetical protein
MPRIQAVILLPPFARRLVRFGFALCQSVSLSSFCKASIASSNVTAAGDQGAVREVGTEATAHLSDA